MKKEKLENIKNQLNGDIEPKERLILLIELSEKYWIETNYKQAEKYSEIALELAKTLDVKSGIAKSHYYIGLSNCYMNNYDKALSHYLKAKKIHEKLQLKKSIAEDWNNIGQIYLYMNEDQKAKDCFQNALKHYEGYARTLNNLAVINNQLKDYENALKYAFQAYENSKRELEKSNGQWSSMLRTNIFALINISEIYMQSEQPEEAKKYALEAIQKTSDSKDDSPLVAIMNLSNVFLSCKEYEEAVRYAVQARKIAEKNLNKEHLKTIYQLLYKSYMETKEFEKAVVYLKKSYDLERKIYTDKMSDKLARLQAEFEIENRELKAQQMAEKASRMASIGVMAAGITHEINQPLCAIKVSAESLLYWQKKNDIMLPQDFVESFENIIEAADKIDEIIQHMRAFWYLKDEHKPSTIDLNTSVTNALSLLERQIYSHGIFLKQKLSKKTLPIMAHNIHIEQIVINIVVNAMHSLDETEIKDKHILISSYGKEDKVVLEISNNGKLIKPENIDKIFDPFFSTKQPGKGMGLGLAIVKRYIDSYKGSIKVDRNRKNGAKFIVKFTKQD
jgi:C4-dicarboxylate-specific signal transduction histidine kinase